MNENDIILERLDMLMEKNDINKLQLSKASNIPYTTICSLYSRGSKNMRVSTLIELANYFEVSLDYMVGK